MLPLSHCTTRSYSVCSSRFPRRTLAGTRNLLASLSDRRQFSALGEASSSEDIDDSTPWKVAIVGSGPSGCYTAKYLVSGAASKLPPSKSSLKIDIIERLPTSYGLVRNGVAPDHPEVKNVQNDFDSLFHGNDEKQSDSSTIGFYGNVRVGGSDPNNSCDVSLDELRALYDVVILAYGCESDRELDLPVDIVDESENEILIETKSAGVKGILSAREFVNWYNGHPDYGWVTETVQDALWNKEKADNGAPISQNIVVIGHGNVALDCARILAKSRKTLDPTDLTSRALDVLRPESNDSKNAFQRSISIVGRRGHVQAAFTIKEVRELTKLMEEDDAKLIVRTDELQLGGNTEASKEELKARPRARIHKLLEGHANKQDMDADANEAQTSPATNVNLRFLTNPIRFQAETTTDEPRLSSVVCERTELEGDVPGAQTAKGTGVIEVIDADLCLVSIGYKGLPIDDSTAASFDAKKGILQNDHGKVATPSNGENDNLAHLYVSGWLKRGPSGIIGTNIGDAKDTVVSILKDMNSGEVSKSPNNSSSSTLKDLLEERNIRFVDWDAYRRIENCESSEDKTENAVGHQKRHSDQPREKIVERNILLQAAEV